MPMNVRMASNSPGISRFNSELARGDQQRRQREIDDRAFTEWRQAQEADAAMRRGFSLPYATQQPATTAPTMAPAAPPAAAPAPALPSAGPMPAPAPATPAPTAAPPAANPLSAVTADSRPQSSGMAPVMRELAQTPGTGRTMATLYGEDRKAARLQASADVSTRIKGTELVFKAINDGNVGMAKVLARQYGIAIPDAVWSNRAVMTRLRIATNVASKMPKLTGDQALTFVGAFMHDQSGDIGKATEAGRAAALQVKPTPQVGKLYFDERDAPVLVGKGGENINAPGKPFPKARPTKGQMGGGAGPDPAQVKLIRFLVSEGVAKDTQDAWTQIRTAATNPRQADQMRVNVIRILAQQPNNQGKSLDELGRVADAFLQKPQVAGANPAAVKQPRERFDATTGEFSVVEE